jgi:hypothetical protein
MWWETASKKSKLKKKDISKNEIISQVYLFGNLHISYVFKAMLNKFRNLFLFLNKFNLFLKLKFSIFSFFNFQFPDFAFRVLWQIFYNKNFMTKEHTPFFSTKIIIFLKILAQILFKSQRGNQRKRKDLSLSLSLSFFLSFFLFLFLSLLSLSLMFQILKKW